MLFLVNPYLIVQPSMLAGMGAFNLAGNPAGLRQTYADLDAELGSFALAGFAAEGIIGTTMPADPGSFAFTGGAATPRADRALAGSAAAFALTGRAAGMLGQKSLAAQGGTFSMSGKDAGLKRSPVIAYQGQTFSAADASSYSFASQPFGAASATRLVVVGVSAFNAAAVTISSVTIGGVAATPLVTALGVDDNGTGRSQHGLYAATVPSGTTGTVDVVLSTTSSRCGVSIWTIDDLLSATPTDTAKQDGTSDASLLDTIDVAASGVLIGYAGCNGDGAQRTTSWAGVTEDFDTFIELTSTHSGGHAVYGAAQTGLTLSATASGAANNAGLVAAAFR